MSKQETTPNIKLMQQENKSLKNNHRHSPGALYGRLNHSATLTPKKVYVYKTNTIPIYQSIQFFIVGKHSCSHYISKDNKITKPISKVVIANQSNMAFKDIKMVAVGVDDAYHFPFKVYEYNLKAATHKLSAPDKSKAPLNG